MKASTTPNNKMMLTLLLALLGYASGQQYPGQTQFWGGQSQQQPQQPQQPQYQQHQQPYQPQPQQQQQLGGMQNQPPQQTLGNQGGLNSQQQLGSANGYPTAGQQQQPQQPGFRQNLNPQQQTIGRLPSYSPDGDRMSETTSASVASRTPFRLFAQQGAQAASQPQRAAGGFPNASGDSDASHAPGAQTAPAAQAAPGGTPTPTGSNKDGVLELEPHGTVKQPQPGAPDSQVFHSTGADQALYAVDWSYPRARNAPASMVLKRWGGISPPEYVAVYRLRGPASASYHAPDVGGSPSYSLVHDEVRHYPWDAARRHAPPRWRTIPRDEDFELLPPSMGNHQYMYRTL